MEGVNRLTAQISQQCWWGGEGGGEGVERISAGASMVVHNTSLKLIAFFFECKSSSSVLYTAIAWNS